MVQLIDSWGKHFPLPGDEGFTKGYLSGRFEMGKARPRDSLGGGPQSI